MSRQEATESDLQVGVTISQKTPPYREFLIVSVGPEKIRLLGPRARTIWVDRDEVLKTFWKGDRDGK